MPEIKQLSPSVVNKIAAGEVIERPASVVKELVENSIDAGAKRIDVSVEQGGSQLVRIVDDGCGISADQLTLAVASHATSKIENADDLFSVRTLGFRGEALASIAEISRLKVRSRPHDSDAGAELEVHGGAMREVAPCASSVGTTIELRDLFYNTPVRRKFLRTPQTEMGHATEAFTRIAIPNPEVHFTLQHNGRMIHELPATQSWRERIAHFFGNDLADSLIEVQNTEGSVHVTGFVANPTHSRSNNKMQYLFLNGRHIRDRSLQHALGEAYRGLLLTGRFPICFLRLTMPADLVDVNVHPSKLEVRFQDSGQIYGQLLGTLRRKFLETDLEARYRAGNTTGEEPEALDAAVKQAAHARSELVDWAKGELSRQTSDATAAYQTRLDLKSGERRPLTLNPINLPEARTWDRLENDLPEESSEESSDETGPPQALQVHNRYLVSETSEGMVVIDQHALHERILYEQIREKVLAGAIESQSLLVPEPVDLGPAEAAAALEHQELLGQLGVKVEPFGGDTVLVSAYPAMLANLGPAEVLRDLVDKILHGGREPDRRDLLDSLLHSISCKAAIKAGDHLSQGEIQALLDRRHLAKDAHHCPHGRPTSLVFTREDLDRQFKRI